MEIDFKEGVFVSNFTFSAGQFLQKKTYNFETKQVLCCFVCMYCSVTAAFAV